MVQEEGPLSTKQTWLKLNLFGSSIQLQTPAGDGLGCGNWLDKTPFLKGNRGCYQKRVEQMIGLKNQIGFRLLDNQLAREFPHPMVLVYCLNRCPQGSFRNTGDMKDSHKSSRIGLWKWICLLGNSWFLLSHIRSWSEPCLKHTLQR